MENTNLQLSSTQPTNMQPTGTQLAAPIKKKKIISKDFLAFLTIQGPFLLWWIIISAFPLAFGLSMGFLTKDPHNMYASYEFAGFDNFIYFFQNPVYRNSLWVAIWLGIVCTGLTMIFAFLFAFIMLKLPKGQGIYRTLWYIPAVTSITAVSQIILILVEPQTGAVNQLLAALHLPIIDVSMKTSSAIIMIVFYSLWNGVGSGMLFWIAGFKSIDSQLYDAAMVDGVNGFQKFWYISIPCLKPFFTYSIITGFMGSIQIYQQVMFISNGGPQLSTQTIVFLIMADSFTDNKMGMAGASSLIVLMFVALFSYFYMKRMTTIFNKEQG